AGNRVQFAHDCQIALPPYKCDAIVTVESTPGYEDRTKPPSWGIAKVEAVGAQDFSKQSGPPGFPGMPSGMPRRGPAGGRLQLQSSPREPAGGAKKCRLRPATARGAFIPCRRGDARASPSWRAGSPG